MKRTIGFSIIELMVAIAVGAFVLLGLVNFASTSSRDQAELTNAAQQLDSAQYALELARSDLEHAGFYGAFAPGPDSVDSPVDPCSLDTGVMRNSLTKPIEVFEAAEWIATGIATTRPCIPTARIAPGTDVLVIRRTNTNTEWQWTNETQISGVNFGLVVNNFYMQSNIQDALIAPALSADDKATFAADTAPKILTGQLFGPSGTDPIPAAIRRFETFIYYIDCQAEVMDLDNDGVVDNWANCSTLAIPNFPAPTLKRLSLTGVCPASPAAPLEARCRTAAGGTAATNAQGWVVEKIAEGIEDMEVSAGLDSDGDGTVDSYDLDPTNDEMGEIVAARIWLLARNRNTSLGHTDTKVYNLGGANVGPFNDGFKRNLYSTSVQIVNSRLRRSNL